MSMPILGDRIVGRYRLLSILGQGGSATVYLAVDENSDRQVAVKVLDPGTSGYSEDMLSRFEREVRVIAKLRDPHTVTMHDSGRTTDGLLFLVFEFIEGRDLEEVIFAGERLSEGVVVHILTQLLQSVREAHSYGLLHRDIKPVNIRVYEYMGDPYHVKLIDFGIAREADPANRRITRDGAMVGTPQFMAPEQVLATQLSPATDIYALGLTAVEMLTGRAAIDGSSFREILEQQLSRDTRVIPPEAVPNEQLRTVIQRMIAYDADERYQSAQEVLDALSAVNTGWRASAGQRTLEPRPASPPTLEESPPPPHREPTTQVRNEGPKRQQRRRDTAFLVVQGVAAVGLAMVVVILALSFLGNDDQPLDQSSRSAPKSPTEGASAAVLAPEALRPEPREALDLTPIVNAAAERVESSQIAAAHAVESPATSGCGQPQPLHRGIRISEERMFAVESYEGYDPEYKHPLVVFIHDAKHAGREHMDFVRETGFLEFSKDERFLSLGVRAREHAFSTSAWDNTPSELAYVQTAIRMAMESHCIDETRIYAVAHGRGAGFLERARCELPLRAMVTTAFRNTLGDDKCADGRLVPHMHLAGMTDPWNPIAGDSGNCVGEPRIALAKKEEIWRSIHGCSDRQTPYEKGDHYACHTWRGCDAPLVFCVHDGGQHWPHGKPHMVLTLMPNCASAYPAARFPMAELAWRFLQANGEP